MDPVNRNKYIFAAAALVLILVAIYFLFIFQKGPKDLEGDETQGEVKELAQLELAKRPFVTLTPTSDGAEIIISVENMSEFDRIEYELTYLADNPQIPGVKIQRGSTGTDVNTKDQKYKKSLLLGTASRGVRSPDTGVADGKLTMHMFKGDIEYSSETDWSLIEVGARPQTIQDVAGNFKLDLPAFTKTYWVIIADTIGIPSGPKFQLENVALPTYGVFSIAPEFTKNAKLTVTSQETLNLKLYSFSTLDSKWQELDSTYNESTKSLAATTSSFATFVVVSAK